MTPEEFVRLPHDDRGSTILAVHWTLSTLTTIFLGLRIYVKRATGRKLWWDEWILIAAWVTIIVTDLSKFILIISSSALDRSPRRQAETEREDRRHGRHEHGRHVRYPIPPRFRLF
jgi:hypothetical protein